MLQKSKPYFRFQTVHIFDLLPGIPSLGQQLTHYASNHRGGVFVLPFERVSVEHVKLTTSHRCLVAICFIFPLLLYSVRVRCENNIGEPAAGRFQPRCNIFPLKIS